MAAESTVGDGRLRRGAQRRQSVLDAALRLVGRGGVGAVSQRAVAAEAGVPPSVVQYHFASMNDLIGATLETANDRYIAELDALPDGAAGIDGFAVLINGYAARDVDSLVAENELWLQATRDPGLAHECARWQDALWRTAVRLVGDHRPTTELFVTVCTGLYVRIVSEPHMERHTIAAILRRAAGTDAGDDADVSR